MKKLFLGSWVLSLVFSACFISEARADESSFCPNYGEKIVEVSIQLPSQKVLAGAGVPVSIELSNVSPVPLAGGSILMRLVGESDNMFVRSFPVTGISLKQEEKKNFTFNMNIPRGLPGGEYTVDVSYISNTGFNVEDPDLSIEEASGANRASFAISVQNDSPSAIVYFDTKSVKIEEGENQKKLVVSLVNTGTSTVSVPVVWKQYYWNAASDETLSGTVIEKVEIAGSSRKSLSYPLVGGRSAYTIMAQAESNGVASILPVKWETGRGEALVSSFGLVNIPESNSLMAYGCIWNVFSDDTEPRTAVLAVGNDTASYTITPGNTFEFSKDISERRSEYDLSVHIVSSQGEVLSTTLKKFSCETLGVCTASQDTERTDADMVFAVTMLAAGVGGLLALWVHRKNKARTNPLIQ